MGYPLSSRPKPQPNLQRQADSLQALVDDRGRSTGDARDDQRAVTRGDAAQQGTVELQAVLLTGAPTTADYNKLVTDLRALAAVLNQVGADVRWTV